MKLLRNIVLAGIISDSEIFTPTDIATFTYIIMDFATSALIKKGVLPNMKIFGRGVKEINRRVFCTLICSVISNSLENGYMDIKLEINSSFINIVFRGSRPDSFTKKLIKKLGGIYIYELKKSLMGITLSVKDTGRSAYPVSDILDYISDPLSPVNVILYNKI